MTPPNTSSNLNSLGHIVLSTGIIVFYLATEFELSFFLCFRQPITVSPFPGPD